MLEIVPLFGGLPAGPELLIILLVLVLLFGANKIPKLARSTGQAMGEFQRGREEIDEELEEMREGKSQDDESRESTGTTTTDETETTTSSESSETEAETEQNT